MAIPPVTSNSSTSRMSDTSETAVPAPKQVLDSDDFMKLLAVQFKSQDPMKPMEDTAFIAQMAQFSSLENSNALTKEMAKLRGDQERATANSYLGHVVTVKNADGEDVTGQVDSVDLIDGSPMLRIDDELYSLSAVLRVEPGVSAPSPQS